MRVSRGLVVGLVVLFSLPLCAQMDKIVIPAGTPEDQALQAITAESDEQKKLPMYEDFLQKFASNPAAVAYGNWQLSQAYDATAEENDAKARMSYIEKFTPAFPDLRFGDGITSYAMAALSDLKDMNRLVAYGEKTLTTNPNHVPSLLLLAGAYVDDPKPGSLGKSVSYAQKAIAAAKADASDADNARKISAGVAHSTLGYAYMKQDKTLASVPELKSAMTLLRGLDEQQFAIAAYRL